MPCDIAPARWAVEIIENISDLSENDLYEVAKLCNKHLVVIFKDQSLTIDDQIRITSAIGKVKLDHGRNQFEKERTLVAPGVLRVTGEKNHTGKGGLFGHDEELDWHTHHTSAKFRYPFVWLYAVKGSKGSRTTWLNQAMAYDDLSDSMKRKIAGIKYASGYKAGTFSDQQVGHNRINYDNPVSLVHTNIEGKTGLYFPFLQAFDIVEGATNDEWEKIYSDLKNHVLQEKYMYHHDWKDGDLVISEQWLSIHKRWFFPRMNTRLLHRIAFNYNKAYKQSL